MQLDVTKERLPHIWMATDETDYTIRRSQAIQYEGLLDYCMYCNHQGHLEKVCKVKLREKKEQKKKDVDKTKSNPTS